MVVMGCYIEIGKYIFRCVHSVEVNKSWKTLTDTATIKLPNVEGSLDKNIKPGDAVLIKFGYDDNLVTEFEGYVSSISPATPLEIMCEDEMWQQKQKQVNGGKGMSWKTTTLGDVLKYLVPDATIECPVINLSPFRIDKSVTSVGAAIKEIKERFTLVAYYRSKKLYVGLAYQEKGLGTVKYHFQKNALVGDLVYKRKEDVKVKVKAISMLPNNTKIEEEVGDKEGETHTLHFYNLTKEELKQQAEEKIGRMRYDGYRGSFTAFGIPFIDHGMVAELMDDKYPERTGSFFVDTVKTSYGPGGIRRTIEPGKKASA